MAFQLYHKVIYDAHQRTYPCRFPQQPNVSLGPYYGIMYPSVPWMWILTVHKGNRDMGNLCFLGLVCFCLPGSICSPVLCLYTQNCRHCYSNWFSSAQTVGLSKRLLQLSWEYKSSCHNYAFVYVGVHRNITFCPLDFISLKFDIVFQQIKDILVSVKLHRKRLAVSLGALQISAKKNLGLLPCNFLNFRYAYS